MRALRGVALDHWQGTPPLESAELVDILALKVDVAAWGKPAWGRLERSGSSHAP